MSCTATHRKRSLRDKADSYNLWSLVESLESYAAIQWQAYQRYKREAKRTIDFNAALWSERQATESRRVLKLLLGIRREGLGR